MAKAYIQSLQNRDGDAVYPVTKAEAVYLQKTDSDGVITQQTLDKKLESMETSFQAGVDTIVAKLKALGVTPTASTPEAIAAAIQTMYTNRYNSGYSAGVTAADNRSNPNSANYKAGYNAGVTAADARVNTNSANYKGGYSAGQSSVTVSCSISGRTATAKTSTGRTATASVALGTDNGSLTFTLTPSGNNNATKVMAAGYYYAGTVTAAGGTAYSAGKKGATASIAPEKQKASNKNDDGASRVSADFAAYPSATLKDGVLTLVLSGYASADMAYKNDHDLSVTATYAQTTWTANVS